MKQSKERVNNISSVLVIDRKRGKSQKVSKALSGKAKHLKGVDSIQIYKYVEIMPVHNKQQGRVAKNRWRRKRKQMFGQDDPSIVCFDNPILYIHKSMFTNQSWVMKHADLGIRIRKFIRTKDPVVAVTTIKEYPEVLLYDGEQIELCLLISMPFNEYKESLLSQR